MEQSKKTFLDQIAVFYYRKWLFIIPILLGITIGLILSYKLPQYYSSSSVILAETQQVPIEYVMPTDKTPFSQRLTVISQQIMSRAKLEQIIKEFGLYNNTPDFFTRAASFIRRVVTGEELSATDELIEEMKRDIEFKPIGEEYNRKGGGGGGNAFTITYSGRTPKTAMQVTNALSSLFIEENLKEREQFAEGTSEFLSTELEKAKRELEIYDKSVKDFKQAHMGGLPEQLDANLKTLDRLQMELQTVSASIKSAEDRRLLLQDQMAMAPNGNIKVLNPMAAELEKLRGDLAILTSTYKDTYPDVVITRKKIKDLEEQLSKNKSGAEPDVRNPAAYAELMTVKSQIETLKRRESDVRKQIRDFERRVELTPANEQKQADLMRDYKISLQSYQALLEKKLNAKLSENMEKRQKGERFRIVDPAFMPKYADRPDKIKVTALGFMGGGAVGTGLVLLFEVLNPAFRKPEDFEGVVNSPVLATIPSIQPAKGETKLKVIKGSKSIA